jgi:hypothetical protein
MTWIKVWDDNNINFFQCDDISFKHISPHLSVKIDKIKFPESVDIFFSYFESTSGLIKFNIDTHDFSFKGVFIASIDIGNKYLTLSMRSDYMLRIPLEERRDQILEEILNNRETK